MPPDPGHRRVFDFTVILDGDNRLTDAMSDAFYEAGCDDAIVRSGEYTVYLDFHREAVSLAMAVGSAIRDVGRAGGDTAMIYIHPRQTLS
jgi:hypothetical protein